MKKPESFATNLHCVTDLLQMLTILVAMRESEGKETLIYPEMVQDYGENTLFLESNYDYPVLRLTTRKRREAKK